MILKEEGKYEGMMSVKLESDSGNMAICDCKPNDSLTLLFKVIECLVYTLYDRFTYETSLFFL